MTLSGFMSYVTILITLLCSVFIWFCSWNNSLPNNKRQVFCVCYHSFNVNKIYLFLPPHLQLLSGRGSTPAVKLQPHFSALLHRDVSNKIGLLLDDCRQSGCVGIALPSDPDDIIQPTLVRLCWTEGVKIIQWAFRRAKSKCRGARGLDNHVCLLSEALLSACMCGRSHRPIVRDHCVEKTETCVCVCVCI